VKDSLDIEAQRVISFIIEVDKLKAVIRKTKPAGFDRYENSAEHSWQVCLLATLLADRAASPVDIQRVVEILLVHDIPEIDAGDQIVYAPHDAARFAAEKQAAERVFGILPEPQAAWCLSRWEEYEARESAESVFAYAVDRLMPLLHNIENDGQSWRENDVPMSRVLEVNSAIGEAMPEVWEHVRGVLGVRFGEAAGDDASA
jgi:putative hydrolase of HD superfamily